MMHAVRRIYTLFFNLISKIIYKFIPAELKKKQFNNYHMYKEEQKLKSYNHFKKYFKTATFWRSDLNNNGVFDPRINKNSIREHAIKLACKNDTGENNFYYLEFGVYKGRTINFFSNYVEKIYGFDSFEGLKENWLGTPAKKGLFNLNKKAPKVKKNVVLVKGWIQDTLKEFLKEKNPKINFVHIDVDTYETTKFILENIKPYLNKGTIILFDELYNYAGWDVGEYKALQEIFKESEYEYKAFESVGCQVVIRIN